MSLYKSGFIKHVQSLYSGSKQNIEHDCDRIYDMFGLSRIFWILRIRVLGIPR